MGPKNRPSPGRPGPVSPDREIPGPAVGRPARKIDGESRITGRAVYTDDIQLPRMLHCRIVRSPHAHARLVDIDFSRALEDPEVIATITGADMPVKYGILPWTRDEYALALTTDLEAALDAAEPLQGLLDPSEGNVVFEADRDGGQRILHVMSAWNRETNRAELRSPCAGREVRGELLADDLIGRDLRLGREPIGSYTTRDLGQHALDVRVVQA